MYNIQPNRPKIIVRGQETNVRILSNIKAGPQGAKGETGATGISGFAGIDLGTADLNTITTPGVYYKSYSLTPTLELNYPQVSGQSGWTLEVRSASSTAGKLVQTLICHSSSNVGSTGRGMYVRRLESGSWSQWRATSTQRVDTTAGRAIYTWDDVNGREQLIYGDTGWRDITSTLINGWTATSVSMRRTTWDVEVRASGLNPAAATSGVPFVLTAGWAGWNGLVDPRPVIYVANNKVWRVTLGSNVSFTGWSASDPAVDFSVKFSVTGSWPTTLPGTAVGTIPYA